MKKPIKIAFYAPLKSPRHKVPSGDQQLAGYFFQALQQAGFEVRLISELRSYNGCSYNGYSYNGYSYNGYSYNGYSYNGPGDADTGVQLQQLAAIERARIKAECKKDQWQPDLWFTYHLYHKAPDLLGPELCSDWQIPYSVAEASYSPRQQQGPWSKNLEQVAAALAQADLVISINPRDIPCVDQIRQQAGKPNSRYLPPFIDPQPIMQVQGYPHERQARFELPPQCPWLLSVGMLRPGAKWASYQLLVEALKQNMDLPWHWLVIGAGPQQQALEALIKPIQHRTTLLGLQPLDEVWRWMKCADYLVWPGVDEALGMVFLEARCCNLNIVAGYSEGVAAACGDQAIFIDPLNSTTLTGTLADLLSGRRLQVEVEPPFTLAEAAEQLKVWLQELLRS